MKREGIWIAGVVSGGASLLALSACQLAIEDENETALLVAEATPAGPSRFERDLVRIAGEYTRYTRVSDTPEWAPFACRVPPPEGVHKTVSADGSPHGRKLYYVFAKNDGAYDSVSRAGKALGEGMTGITAAHWLGLDETGEQADPRTSPVGQVIVKETWAPKVEGDATHETNIGEPGDLFVMMKYNPETPGTDQGWVYGVVSRAGDVHAIGELNSCVGCHTETDRDRLYGHQWSWPADGWPSTRGDG